MSPGSLLPRNSAISRGSLPVGVACVFLAVVVGCQTNAPKIAPAEPPAVPVSLPVQREVTDYVEFTGQTKAVHLGGHPPPSHRLPGEDAVPGRGRGQGGGPLVRGRSAALQSPARPGAGPGRSLPGVAQAGQDNSGPRPGRQCPGARLDQPAAIRPGAGRRRRGRGQGQGV